MPVGHYRGDAISCVSVPQRRDAATFCLPGEYTFHFLAYFLHVATDQNIGSDVYRNWPLCILADSQTRHAKERRLLLKASRVGNDDSCATLQREELKVRGRLE